MQNKRHSQIFKLHRNLLIFNKIQDASSIVVESSRNQQFRNRKNKQYPQLHLIPCGNQREIKTDIDSETDRYLQSQKTKMNRRCSHSIRRNQIEYNFNTSVINYSFKTNKKDQACQTYFLDEFVNVEI
ncbi:unnamed protein product [Paramecium primaurelia]|uniref:Uncharacterized protein n=1 Tax=Paramecium primaurelia TaxID=5886 RepID=A0A8S1MNJ1_PARPR|nr:unnamed protein product [Paramecium primaurelia]